MIAPSVQQMTAQQMTASGTAPTNTVTPEQIPKITDVTTVCQMPLPFPLPAIDHNNPAASSFAAGFAAATAHYQQQFFAMMSKMAGNGQLPEGFSLGGNNSTSNSTA